MLCFKNPFYHVTKSPMFEWPAFKKGFTLLQLHTLQLNPYKIYY